MKCYHIVTGGGGAARRMVNTSQAAVVGQTGTGEKGELGERLEFICEIASVSVLSPPPSLIAQV